MDQWCVHAANRVMQGMFMLLEAKRWIEKELPWWRRRQGKDHIWYATTPALHGLWSRTASCLQAKGLMAGVQHDACIMS